MLSNTYVRAGIPVVDGANLSQNIVNTLENVSQTLQQVQEYRTQLQQHQNQIQNTLAPAAFIWDNANGIISELRNATDTIGYYKNSLGSIDSYLNRFQNTAYYHSSPCYSARGCSKAEWDAMKDNQKLASDARKRANDALLRGIDNQQDALERDAQQLGRLQNAAQGASGQMAAIGYANQLASQQANQLLQIRSLLLAQQNAVATQMQAENNEKAQQEAAEEALRQGGFVPSPEVRW